MKKWRWTRVHPVAKTRLCTYMHIAVNLEAWSLVHPPTKSNDWLRNSKTRISGRTSFKGGIGCVRKIPNAFHKCQDILLTNRHSEDCSYDKRCFFLLTDSRPFLMGWFCSINDQFRYEVFDSTSLVILSPMWQASFAFLRWTLLFTNFHKTILHNSIV